MVFRNFEKVKIVSVQLQLVPKILGFFLDVVGFANPSLKAFSMEIEFLRNLRRNEWENSKNTFYELVRLHFVLFSKTNNLVVVRTKLNDECASRRSVDLKTNPFSVLFYSFQGSRI